MPAISEIPKSRVLEKPSDMRKKPYRKIIIFSPVGDMSQLDGFAKHVKELGIGKKADFLFIYRQGLAYKDYGLSAIHIAEKMPIGTSGCFFSGQAMSYQLGYEIVVVADLDAFLDSGKSFDGMISQATETSKGAVPLSRSPREQKPANGYFVVNQWGVFPRSVFEKAGFEIPYTRRGGEDWEFSNRLKHYGQVKIYRGGFVTHEKVGMGIAEKLKNPKKYYPYLKGLMLAFSVAWQYDILSYLRFLAWFGYYNTFAIMHGDAALAKTVRLQDFSEKDMRENKSGSPPIKNVLAAAAMIPFTMIEALMTIRRIKRVEIPSTANAGKIVFP